MAAASGNSLKVCLACYYYSYHPHIFFFNFQVSSSGKLITCSKKNTFRVVLFSSLKKKKSLAVKCYTSAGKMPGTASPTEVNLALWSLEVKNGKVVVIMVRKMSPVQLSPAGALLLCLGECIRIQPRASICSEESKSRRLGKRMTQEELLRHLKSTQCCMITRACFWKA